jgi:hypothetical protein
MKETKTYCLLSRAAQRAALVTSLAAISTLAWAQDPRPVHSGAIQGKLWVVSIAQASNVVFPAPSATPDATFSTNGIAYIGQEKTAGSTRNCYTISSWVANCASVAYGLTFSGLPNANLPGNTAANSSTLMNGDTWGIMVEFTGTVGLTNGQQIVIYHDDGASLEINGSVVPGFAPGVGIHFPDSVTWTGGSGTFTYDLLYANAQGGGAWLLFGPQLCCQ